ncbi:hypothetical protein [Nocardioides sp.]|uniref:hypothetical protein n=2 Tax=Nocardioides sp. TaxID=35761 RepID=UPI00321AF427
MISLGLHGPHRNRPSHAGMPGPRAGGVGGVAILAALTLTAGATPASALAPLDAGTTTASAAVTDRPSASPTQERRKRTGNLIRNGSAEKTKGAPSDFTKVAIKGWKVTGTDQFTAATYAPKAPDPQAYGIRLAKNSPGPGGRRNKYFTGAYHTSSAETGRATQTIDLAKQRSLIKQGARFDLVGWLGGYAGNEDRMKVTVKWLNAKGRKAGRPARLKPVTLQDRDILTPGSPGDEVTLLAKRTASGTVPRKARKARVTVQAVGASGVRAAYADKLSLKLRS